MINILIVSVGKLDKSYWKLAATEYFKRLQHDAKVTCHSINESVSNDINNNIITDSNNIKKVIDKYNNYEIFLLDIAADSLITSEQLADILVNNQIYKQAKIMFIIGGSYGLSQEFKNNNRIKRISFGRITLPHQLCYVILLEQIYRAFQIINKTPYHK